jgi:crossover junction endodeoxyribonuclease RuvC
LDKEKIYSGQIILGVDPGTNILGYSIIAVDKNNIKIILNGIILLKKQDSHYERLRIIFDRLNKLIVAYKPEILAIEAPFFGKNVQSMLKLGRAQGAAIVAAASLNLNIIEYSPKRIKQSITGNGNASKDQVAKMLQYILKMETLPEYYDETDALAVAVCHVYSNSTDVKVSKTKKTSGWENYVKANPKKISGL